MNSFERCSQLAARSLADLHPFLEETQGRYVLTDKGRLSRVFQETFGDLIFNSANGTMHTVELKAEEKWTGNLFLEIWSNFNFTNHESYTALGPTPGWLLKLNADLLFYHFLSHDKLVICSLPALQRWAFINKSRNYSEPDARGERHQLAGRVFDFRQRKQERHQQKNVTVGGLVPVKTLEAELSPPPKVCAVRQLKLSLFGDEAA